MQLFLFSRIFNGKKSLHISSVLCLLLVLVVCCSYLVAKQEVPYNEPLYRHYLLQASRVEQSLQLLQQAANRKAPARELKTLFRASRLAYKQISPLSEHLHRYETKNLNGPALPRIEEDNPHTIIDPHGYQLLEELLYQPKLSDSTYRQIATESSLMEATLQRMQSVPGLEYAFKHSFIFDALRATCFRIMALDIAGFDSPVAQLSLPETRATLEGIEAIMSFYRQPAVQQNEGAWSRYAQALAAAKDYLQRPTGFNRFDRIAFIRNYATPLTASLVQLAQILGYNTGGGQLPINPAASSLFDPQLFRIDFFSPNERYLLTEKRQALGKLLFSDPVFSGNGERSCATCHQPQRAFTDGLPVAAGMEAGSLLNRNTPTLWNSVLQTKQFYDSRAMILEHQVGDVVHNVKEMNGSLEQFSASLPQHSRYATLFREAYPNEANPFNEMIVANAISSYMRSLVSLNSRFDQFMRGDNTRLNATEQQGFNLFMGKAKCGTCHFLPVLNGLVPPVFTETESEVLGVPARKKGKAQIDEDLGKYNFTGATIHKHAFKTPTLRNVALTAPYMHNGVFNMLEEVVDFYNKGGGAGLGIQLENQTLPAEKLGLSKQEQKAIVAFMHSLTDTSGMQAVPPLR